MSKEKIKLKEVYILDKRHYIKIEEELQEEFKNYFDSLICMAKLLDYKINIYNDDNSNELTISFVKDKNSRLTLYLSNYHRNKRLKKISVAVNYTHSFDCKGKRKNLIVTLEKFQKLL